ncbi:hypothetical protein CIG75_19045 [Tumebacillus algifaecis]|uniref:PBSX phage terminase small subunit-like N-terminal domain-containing protein n=1 Tax=Tumebacillus algifaecis TaxID=1214604 RepID=A0A223D5I6_9BACL|nr:phage terminase small subunit [Tumebacillus algifaecis]ASS76831.1 hypothetical protein CIG75_19045 [Tumebacillus algifaecis]
MARKASPEYEQAKKLYLDSGGSMPLVEIATMVGKADSQIRKWKSTKKWDEELKGNVTKSNGNVTELGKGNVTVSDAPLTLSGQPAKRPHMLGNQRAQGGRGNPSPRKNFGNKGGGAPIGNENAVAHGFFRSQLPERLQGLFDQVQNMDLVDMAWNNLSLTMTVMLDSLQQLAAIQSERRMVKKKKFVIPADDEGAPIEIEGELLQEIEWEHHTALDQQAKALVALDRQQARLDNQIRKFLELADKDDERRLKLELMQSQIDRAKLDVERIKADVGRDDDEGLRIVVDYGDGDDEE